MKKTKILALMLVIVMLLSLVLTSCDKIPFLSKTCKEHTFDDGICTKCKYVCPHDETDDTVVAPTCDKSGYTEKLCKTCGKTLIADTASALGHNGSPCTVCGYVFEAPELFYYNLIANNTSLSSPALVIKDVKLTISESSTLELTFAELGIITSGDALEAFGNCTIKAASVNEGTTVTTVVSGAAVLTDNTLYISFDNGDGIDAESISAAYPITAVEGGEELLAKLEGIYPAISGMLEGDLLASAGTMLEQNKFTIDEAMKSIVDEIFSVNGSAAGYTLTFKAGKLLEVNELLYTSTVSELADMLLGEGFYAELPQTLGAFLDMTVSQLVLAAKSSGFDVNTAIDSVFAVLEEAGLAADLGMTADELKNEITLGETSSKQIGAIIVDYINMANNVEPGSEDAMTVATLKLDIKDLLDSYKDENVYSLITGETDPEMLAETKASVDNFITEFDKTSVVEIHTDMNSRFVNATLVMNDFDGVSANVELLPEYVSEFDYEKVIDIVNTKTSEIYEKLTNEKLAELISQIEVAQGNDVNVEINAETNEIIITSETANYSYTSHPEYKTEFAEGETVTLTGVQCSITTEVYTFKLRDNAISIVEDADGLWEVTLGVIGTSTSENGTVDMILSAAGAEAIDGTLVVSDSTRNPIEHSFVLYFQPSTGTVTAQKPQ